ncbi:hypothetical protein SteCoe_31104 [Stentor coeruleus]|uniref:Uncharacterized protein n=1 Tax=Stentor coeruleus TaxID=5963 RepID=A0A1R2B251_9CILI|nr:hypothetical protein SteCoe_31104 [Stentor coeruleus]
MSMETRFLSVSNKTFDYKLPLIKHTYGYNYASNPVIHRIKMPKMCSRFDLDITFNISIKSLSDTISKIKNKKSTFQKTQGSTQYLNFPKNLRFNYKKKEALPQIVPENKTYEKFELSGWEIN